MIQIMCYGGRFVRKRVYSLVAGLMLWLMMPGAVALAQDGLHWLVEGHTVHDSAAGHEHNESGSDEHGCSGPYHFCGCHTSAPFVASSVLDPRTPATQPPKANQIAGLGSPIPSLHLDPLFRPPIA